MVGIVIDRKSYLYVGYRAPGVNGRKEAAIVRLQVGVQISMAQMQDSG
jgi:hypothetical protein